MRGVTLSSPHHAERGVVLFVAMIALLALALGALALDRAVATDATIAANVDARTYATLLSSDAIERAVAGLFETGAIADRLADDVPHNYFASRQAGEDVRGVPHALHAIENYPTDAAIVDAGERHQLRYVIERLCLRSGVAATDNCTLTPPSAAAARGAPPPGEPPRTPIYRVTVRVDGPAATTAFVQATLGESPTHHRLSWRALDE